MKQGITIMLVLMLAGCTAPGEQLRTEIQPEISTMFVKNGVENSFTESGAIRYRLDNMRVHELAALRFIMNDEDNETAMEYTITDKETLAEFKQFLETIQVDLSLETNKVLPYGQNYAFEVTVKDKPPVVFKGNEYGFCLAQGKCLLLPDMQFFEFFSKYADEGTAVLPVDLDEATVDLKTWAEEPPKELKETYQEPLFENDNATEQFPSVYNSWYFNDDKWQQALKMAFYINDEFDDYHQIKDWNKAAAGLAMQQVQDGYWRNNYGNDLSTYYGPHGDIVKIKMDEDILPFHKLQPDRFVTYSMIEQAGSVLFGNDFVMPEINEKTLAVYPMFTVMHSKALKLCDIHTPYEYFFATMEAGLILSETVDSNKRTYDLLIYTQTIESPDDGKNSHTLDEMFYLYRNDYDEAYEKITGNEEHFKQVRIELEETEKSIRINSFKFLNQLEKPEEATTAAESDVVLDMPEASTDSDISTQSDISTEADIASPDDTNEGVSE